MTDSRGLYEFRALKEERGCYSKLLFCAGSLVLSISFSELCLPMPGRGVPAAGNSVTDQDDTGSDGNSASELSVDPSGRPKKLESHWSAPVFQVLCEESKTTINSILTMIVSWMIIKLVKESQSQDKLQMIIYEIGGKETQYGKIGRCY